MYEDVLLLGSFLLFMLFFAGVGLSSMLVKEDTTDDYLVAGRGMHPALAALSAVSTWNSGYMFIGFIGFIFLNGYSAIWIAVVSTIGQLVAWIWLYKYIQKQGEERGIRSLSSLVSNTTGSPEAKVAAILSVIFLSIYAAAQLTAGGVALEVMLGWWPTIGILIGFVLVVAYCYAGGIRASIWTDAAQSCVMIVGSTILCYVAIKGSGGFSGLHNQLMDLDPGMVSLFPAELKFGATLWIAAFFLGGLGVAGQPQVVSRVMTLKDDKARKEAMVWFFVWQTPFIIIMFLIGLACRVLLPELGASGAETGLPKLAMEKLSPFLGGLILASIFAATMSTADSQVLACTAAITDDIKPEWSQDHKTTKAVTLVVAAFATIISLVGQQFPGFGDSVFALVVLAVYGLGAIFVPLLLVRMTGYEPDSKHAIAMMMSAMIGVVVWTLLGYGGDVFPSVPGMGAAFATHFGFCWFRSESPDNPFGRYAVPSQKIATIGAVLLLATVVATEGSYQKFSPGAHSLNRDSSGYQLNYSVIQNIQSETVNIGDGETIQSVFEVMETSNALISVRFIISYGETNEGLGSECDDVITVPDFSDVNGPHDQISDNPRTTSSCDQSDIEVAWVKTNADGFYQAEVGVGEYSKEGTNGDLTSIQKTMSESYKMQGNYSVDITVEANDALPFTNDPGEAITISWITLEYMPGDITRS
tara:strand:+ start:1100 stop:3199 length:2100 start_codon:yes stop_codon:yes gene_type:complete